MIRGSAAASLALWATISFAVTAAPPAQESSDVIARVGDQAITFGEINTMLNSSAIVGLSIPALGTHERDTVRITLLDRFISANLLYLDALKRGVDQDPLYQRDLARFDNAMLAGLYRDRVLVGEIPLSEEEVQAYAKSKLAPGKELTDDIRASVESSLRRQKLESRLAEARARTREDVEVKVREESLGLAGDEQRSDDVVIAEFCTETLRWGDVKDAVVRAGKGATIADPLASEQAARQAALQREIDVRIMAKKARALGLDQDPVYRARVGEYRKTRLINLHRDNLVARMSPSDEELKAYFERNRERIAVPEARKVQMVVLRSQEEAEAIKAKIASGEMTMYVAARDYSIAASAKQDLGEVGWVYRGKVAPALDQVIFSVGPGEVGGPIETTGGWHLVTVQDVQEAMYESLDDAASRRLTTRKLVQDRLDEYTASLRKSDFPVEVYQDVILRLSQQEADTVRDLTARAQEPGSRTQQRLEELKQLMKPAR
jgi:peptidyl-prolyl cis-trans isomerase C